MEISILSLQANKGQAVLAVDQNVLDVLENATICEPIVLLIVGK